MVCSQHGAGHQGEGGNRRILVGPLHSRNLQLTWGGQLNPGKMDHEGLNICMD